MIEPTMTNPFLPLPLRGTENGSGGDVLVGIACELGFTGNDGRTTITSGEKGAVEGFTPKGKPFLSEKVDSVDSTDTPSSGDGGSVGRVGVVLASGWMGSPWDTSDG
jgi:hypothetical protein